MNIRSCKCRASEARYINEAVVEVWGDTAQVLGIPNEDMFAALNAKNLLNVSMGPNIRCWMFPTPHERVRRMGKIRRR